MRITKVARTKDMIMIDQGSGTPVWARTTAAVKGYVKSVLKPNDKGEIVDCPNVTLTCTEKDGMYHVSRVSVDGQIPPTVASPVSEVPTAKSVIGVNAPIVTSETKKYTPSGNYSNDRNESIERQCVIKATAQTLVSLQGHIDPNNVLAIAETIYNYYISKIQPK